MSTGFLNFFLKNFRSNAQTVGISTFIKYNFRVIIVRIMCYYDSVEQGSGFHPPFIVKYPFMVGSEQFEPFPLYKGTRERNQGEAADYISHRHAGRKNKRFSLIS
jgi:hypothetical protein